MNKLKCQGCGEVVGYIDESVKPIGTIEFRKGGKRVARINLKDVDTELLDSVLTYYCHNCGKPIYG